MDKKPSSPLKKVLIDKVCRTFNLVFNQVTMYNADHPAAVRTINQFYDTLRQGLALHSPIVIIHNRDQFFFEEDAFDARINTVKMGGHFKKAEIQSVSFDKGLSNEQLKQFIRILSDLKTYPNADAMKKALADIGLVTIRINYVFYKKMTTDDEVVDKGLAEQSEREQTSGDADGPGGGGHEGPSTEDILEMIAANVMFEELEKTMSIRSMVANPTQMSEMIIENDLASSSQMAGEGQQPGHAIAFQLQEFRKQVDQALAQPSEVNLQDLAEGVFDLKKQLLEGIEAQKDKGVVYIAEEEIRQEADDITDEVMTHLIIEEYGRGGISIRRLAQIILRLVPQTGELKRLLPRLKAALLAEGMPLADFLALVQELKNELQSDELALVLEQSAEEIGLDPEELIREVMENPTQAAELICLAAEIKKGTGDEGALSGALVEYIEKIGSEMALNEIEGKEDSGGQDVFNAFSKIKSELVGKLRERNIDTTVLNTVESKLVERMEESISKLRTSVIFRHISASDAGAVTRDTILKILAEKSQDQSELENILDEVRENLLSRGVEEERFQTVFDEILGKSLEEQKPTVTGPAPARPSPRGTLNRTSTLYILEKEISRSLRYDTPFSALSFSIIKVTPKQPVGKISVTWDDVVKVAMVDLAGIVRDTDLVGMLDTKMLLVMQPMTVAADSKLALGRVTRILKAHDFMIKEIPFELKFAGVSTGFDHERTPDLKSFVKTAHTDLLDLSTRLSNIQDLL